MTERTCGNCRWWSAGPTGYGYCHRRPPIVPNSDESFPSTHKSCWCGDWADKTITPEQEEWQELTRRFAVAIMSTEYSADLQYDRIWMAAKNMADEEPQMIEE